MRIDDRIESLVREALTAVVKGEPERMRRAFLAFRDDRSLNEGTQLATAVSVYVLNDVYGQPPTPTELREVADNVVNMEDWTDVSSDEIVAFLSAAYSGTNVVEVVQVDRIAAIAFLTAGHLLASCCEDGEYWFNYLDRVETAIEASA